MPLPGQVDAVRLEIALFQVLRRQLVKGGQEVDEQDVVVAGDLADDFGVASMQGDEFIQVV